MTQHPANNPFCQHKGDIETEQSCSICGAIFIGFAWQYCPECRTKPNAVDYEYFKEDEHVD